MSLPTESDGHARCLVCNGELNPDNNTCYTEYTKLELYRNNKHPNNINDSLSNSGKIFENSLDINGCSRVNSTKSESRNKNIQTLTVPLDYVSKKQTAHNNNDARKEDYKDNMLKDTSKRQRELNNFTGVYMENNIHLYDHHQCFQEDTTSDSSSFLL